MTDKTAAAADTPGTETPETVGEVLAGVATPDIGQLRYTNPKNYLGVPICVQASPDPLIAVGNTLVSDVTGAYAGAELFGLLNGDDSVTALGEEVCRRATAACGDFEAAIEALTQLKGSRERLIEECPALGAIAKMVVRQYEPAMQVLELVDTLGGVTLADLLHNAIHQMPTVAAMLLSDAGRAQLADVPVQALTPMTVSDPEMYAGTAVYQLKGILYHAGLLDQRGADTSALDPGTDWWEIDATAISPAAPASTGGLQC